MNKEFVQTKKISEKTGKEMVAVTNEEGILEFRESLNNLEEILVAENLKEKIEEELKEQKDKKNEIEEKFKSNKSIWKIIKNVFPLIFAMLLCSSVLKTYNEQSVIAEPLLIKFLMATCGFLVVCEVVDIVQKNITLKRLKLANEASINMLDYLLGKTNEKLKELEASSVISEKIINDKTKVNTTELDNLNIKLDMISDCAKNPNNVATVPVGVYRWGNEEENELVIDEEEQRIIADCKSGCQKVGMRRVLRKNGRR